MAMHRSAASIPVPEVPAGREDRGSLDLYSRLLHERIVVVRDPVVDGVANDTIAQLLHLEGDDPEADISLYLTCTAGTAWAVLAVLDTMEYLRCDVATMASGVVAGAPVALLARGAAGKRAALPHAQIVLEQPTAVVEGQSSDVERIATETLRVWEQLTDLLAEATGRDRADITAAFDRRNTLDADMARDFGLIDTVLEHR